MIYDDGSTLDVYDDGSMMATSSPDYGSTVYTATDASEAGAMAPAYPANGQPWWNNAAMLGVSRVIDAASMAAASAINKGSVPGTYAGQNGRTYAASGTGGAAAAAPRGVPLLLLAGAAFLLLS